MKCVDLNMGFKFSWQRYLFSIIFLVLRCPTGRCDITALEKTVKQIGVRSRTKFITCKSTLPIIINYEMKEYDSTLMFYVVKTTQRSIEIFLIVKSLSVTCEKTCDKLTSHGFDYLRVSSHY